MAVVGESGSGKTALIGYAINQAKAFYAENNSAVKVIFRFIGATPSSTDGRSLLESLCKQISNEYGASDSTLPSEYPKLVEEFTKRLALATADKPLVLFLDALDQLSDVDNARSLSWLPSTLPQNVHVVVSCLPGECSNILEKKIPCQSIVFLRPMNRTDGKELLNKWLANVGRRLQADQEKEILEKFAVCGLHTLP